MPGAPTVVHATVDLNPLRYQSSLSTFRMMLETVDPKQPFLRVAVVSPGGGTVEIQVRTENAYLVGFRGAGQWYSFDGETGGWGPPCGTGSNYNELGKVGRVTYDDLKALATLSAWRPGVKLDRRLIAILIAVTAEAARFATVATYFTGMTNSVGTVHSPYLKGGVDFEFLKTTYFNNWEKPPEPKMEPGKVYHFTKSGILLPRHR